jgi:hypothetical protein
LRLPNSDHTDRPWRIHELIPDFRLEDVWALPTPGGPDDFPRLVRFATVRAVELNAQGKYVGDGSRGIVSRVSRALFELRWKLGELLGWDDRDSGVGRRVATLRDRLPADLRGAPRGPDLAGVPMTSLYLTEDEWATEMANRTVHSVMHIGWVRDGKGGYRGQMAVLVKPNGPFGAAYMSAIKPFRYLIVYPALMRSIERYWQTNARSAGRRSPSTCGCCAGRSSSASAATEGGGSTGRGPSRWASCRST